MPVEVYTKGGITYEKNTYTGEVKRLKQSIRTTEQEKKDLSSSKSSKSQSDYVNYYERQKSIDPNMISNENKITRVKDDSGRTIGVSDPVARKSFGFSQPLTAQQEQDVLIAESQRQVQRQAPKKEQARVKAENVFNQTPTRSTRKDFGSSINFNPSAGTPGMVRSVNQRNRFRNSFDEPKGVTFPEFLSNVANLRGRKNDNKILGGVANLAAGFSASVISTNKFVSSAVTEPGRVAENIGSTGKTFLQGDLVIPEIGQALRNEPQFATGFIGAEILTGGVGGELGKAAGKTASKAIRAAVTRFDPRFIKASDDVISGIPSAKSSVDIELAGGFKSTSEPLRKQVSLAGDDVLGVSAQRNLFNRRTKEILVDKPLPTPDSPPLEKAFFADPRGRLRQSRLGSGFKGDPLIKPDADDFVGSGLTEDIVFAREKPQALFFEDAKVASFPDNLKVVEYKLRSGKSLSAAEQKALTKWQLTPTSEFKTPGFLSSESEIVLAPGDVIEKVGKRGVTLLRPEGKLFPERVTIYEAKIKSGDGLTTSSVPSFTTSSLPSSFKNAKTTTLSSRLKPSRRASASQVIGRSMGISSPSSSSVPSSPNVLSGSVSYKVDSPPLSYSFTSRKSPSSSVIIPSKSSVSVKSSFKIPAGSGSRGGSSGRSSETSISGASPSASAASSSTKSSTINSLRTSSLRSNKPTSGASGFPTSPSRSTTFTPFPTFKKPRERPRDFSVQVRKQGKFVTIGRGLSKQSAITRGRTVIGSSPLASFKILQGRTALNINKLGLGGRGFFQSKKGSGVIVEKTKFRISSLGEKIGIPGKAKRKRLNRNIFGGLL